MKIFELIDKYEARTITTNSFRNLIKGYFNDLLSEYKFRELEYLKIYPFLSELQDEDIYKENMLGDKIAEIRDVLEGRRKFSYDLWINLAKCNIENIINIWEEYIEKGFISYQNYQFLEKELISCRENRNTLDVVCMEKLLTILVGMPIESDDFYTYNLLYIQEVDRECINGDVDKLLDTLVGKRPIHILLSYSYNEFNCILL